MWENVHTVATPMEPGTRLVKANYPLTPDLVLQRRYHDIVGSIGYLVQTTQFDLAFVYGQLSQFLHNPGPVHLAAAESALAYVRGTADWGLTYYDLDADKRNVLTGWVNSDFASDSDTCRSVTGYIMSHNCAPISWHSCRQGDATLSSSEAEYIASSAVAQPNAYLCSLLSGFDHPLLGSTCVWEDTARILISENPVNHDQSHHVDVKFHFFRERVRAGEIKLYKCWGHRNVADALTKSLPQPTFHKFAFHAWDSLPLSAFCSHRWLDSILSVFLLILFLVLSCLSFSFCSRHSSFFGFAFKLCFPFSRIYFLCL